MMPLQEVMGVIADKRFKTKMILFFTSYIMSLNLLQDTMDAKALHGFKGRLEKFREEKLIYSY